MGDCDVVNVQLQFGYDAPVSFPSIGISSNSMPDRVSGMAPFNPIFGYSLDPFNQVEYLQSSSMVCGGQHPFLENDGICDGAVYYSLAQDHSVSAFFEDPRIISAMIGPFGESEVQAYSSNWEGHPNGGSLLHAAVSRERKISVDEAAETPPKEKRRKRGGDENEEQKQDPSKNGDGVSNQRNEKKQKTEGDTDVNSGSKRGGHHKKSGTSKLNYVHVRACQGQVTNIHSLAERVRREKISERLRVLQDLVPGCSKITGKAVMLDKIINYVKSLQHHIVVCCLVI